MSISVDARRMHRYTGISSYLTMAATKRERNDEGLTREIVERRNALQQRLDTTKQDVSWEDHLRQIYTDVDQMKMVYGPKFDQTLLDMVVREIARFFPKDNGGQAA